MGNQKMSLGKPDTYSAIKPKLLIFKELFLSRDGDSEAAQSLLFLNIAGVRLCLCSNL